MKLYKLPYHHSIANATKYGAFWQRLARVSNLPHLDLNICKTTTNTGQITSAGNLRTGTRKEVEIRNRLSLTAAADKRQKSKRRGSKTWKHFEQICPILVTLPNAETSNSATICFFADFPTINKEETENWQINPFKVGEQGRQGEAKTFFLSYNCRIARFCETVCSTEWYQQQQEFTSKIENMEVDELNKCLAKFYVSVRKTDGSYFKKTSLLSIRAALDWHLKTAKSFKNMSLFYFIFSNNHQCNYTKTISRFRLLIVE